MSQVEGPHAHSVHKWRMYAVSFCLCCVTVELDSFAGACHSEQVTHVIRYLKRAKTHRIFVSLQIKRDNEKKSSTSRLEQFETVQNLPGFECCPSHAHSDYLEVRPRQQVVSRPSVRRQSMRHASAIRRRRTNWHFESKRTLVKKTFGRRRPFGEPRRQIQ